jgi:hypothetical protein
MSEVTARKPTKKAFYFPKSADQATPEADETKSAKASKAPKAAKVAKAAKSVKATKAAKSTKATKGTSATKSAKATGASKTSRAKSKAEVAAPAPAVPEAPAAPEAPATATAAAPATEAAKKPARDTAAKGKDKRAKKEKVVRDSFTMPKADYERIAILKQRCLEAGVPVKKSELLRAGLQLLEASSAQRLAAAIAALETVKTGRPAKDE